MLIETLTPERLNHVAELIARRQTDPDTHVAYLSSGRESIAAELAKLEPEGLAGVLVAVDAGGKVRGVLGAEHEEDPPRVWWFGPYVDVPDRRQVLADRLYERARRRLPTHVTQEEVACDDRSRFLAAFAQRHGFATEEAAALLSQTLDEALPDGAFDDAVVVRTPGPTDRAAAAALHDALFPGTHSTGRRALRSAAGRVAVVGVRENEVVGYAVAEVQEDGDGYLDFIGVRETTRGRGIGIRPGRCDVPDAARGSRLWRRSPHRPRVQRVRAPSLCATGIHRGASGAAMAERVPAR